MNKQSIAMATGLNDNPEDILKKLSLGGNCQSYYNAMRGWQIATVFNGKNYLIDCVEEQSKVLIYQ